MDLKVLY